jgi:hypothetical protein
LAAAGLETVASDAESRLRRRQPPSRRMSSPVRYDEASLAR